VVLVRYLLGTADREDEARFDELSVTDATFAERLRAIEHELADAYVRGELSPSDRDRWEARYLVSQHGRDDLTLAEALAARDEPKSSAPGLSSIMWGLAAAAVLFVAVATGYLVSHRSGPAPQTVARQPPTPAAGAPRDTQPPSAGVVAFTLMPSIRSIDEPPKLTIPAGTTDVKLTLRLDGDEYRVYGLTLRDLASNTVAWRSSDVTAEGSGANRSLVVSIPASTFQTGRYLVNVNAGPANAREIVATYPLVVVLQ
jgi:hypothetical protein